MAYAATTENLKQDVNRKINGMRNTELVTLTDHDEIAKIINANVALRDYVVELLWDKTEPDLRERLEKYNKEGSIRGRVTIPAEHTNDGNPRQIDIAFAVEKVIPCTIASSDGYGARTKDVTEISFNHDPLFAAYAEAYKNRIECNKRWEAVASQVRTFLSSCKSVNEALKLWPDVARYLPQDALDKVNQKAEKKVKEESSALAALAAMDMDTINTSAVLARMAGARF